MRATHLHSNNCCMQYLVARSLACCQPQCIRIILFAQHLLALFGFAFNFVSQRINESDDHNVTAQHVTHATRHYHHCWPTIGCNMHLGPKVSFRQPTAGANVERVTHRTKETTGNSKCNLLKRRRALCHYNATVRNRSSSTTARPRVSYACKEPPPIGKLMRCECQPIDERSEPTAVVCSNVVVVVATLYFIPRAHTAALVSRSFLGATARCSR